MVRWTGKTILAWVFILMLSCQVNAADDSPVPASSFVVAQINSFPALKTQTTKFLEVVAPDIAKLFPKWVDDQLKEQLAGRELTALTPNERIYLSVTNFEGVLQGRPPVTLFVPITNYKKFRDKLLTTDEQRDFETTKDGYDRIDTLFLVDLTKRGYVAITQNEPTAQLLTKPYTSVSDKTLSANLTTPFFQSDAALYVNWKEINAAHGEMLQSYAKYLLALMQTGGLGVVPKLDPQQMAVIKKIVEGLAQAIGDGQGMVLGASVKAEGITICGEFDIVTGTETAKLFAAEKPTKLDELATLPRGNVIYSASHYSPAVGAISRQLNREYQAPADEDRAIAAIAKFDELFAKAAGQGLQSISNGPDRSLQIITAEDAASLTDAHIKVIRNLGVGGWFQNLVIEGKPVLKENAVEHDGFTLHQVTMRVDFDASVSSIKDANLREATIESMKRLINEKTTYWFGHNRRRYVQVVAKDWDTAKKLLDEALLEADAIGKQPAFAATRRALPAEATQLLLTEAGPTIASLGTYMKSVYGALPAFPGVEVPDIRLPKEPVASYFGFAITLKPTSAGFCGFIPAEAAKLARQSVVIPDPNNP